MTSIEIQNIKKEERLIPTAFNSIHPINATDRLMPTAYPLLTLPHLSSEQLKNSQTNKLTIYYNFVIQVSPSILMLSSDAGCCSKQRLCQSSCNALH
jgi:hypothetical protein